MSVVLHHWIEYGRFRYCTVHKEFQQFVGHKWADIVDGRLR